MGIKNNRENSPTATKNKDIVIAITYQLLIAKITIIYMRIKYDTICLWNPELDTTIIYNMTWENQKA